MSYELTKFQPSMWLRSQINRGKQSGVNSISCTIHMIQLYLAQCGFSTRLSRTSCSYTCRKICRHAVIHDDRMPTSSNSKHLNTTGHFILSLHRNIMNHMPFWESSVWLGRWLILICILYEKPLYVLSHAIIFRTLWLFDPEILLERFHAELVVLSE